MKLLCTLTAALLLAGGLCAQAEIVPPASSRFAGEVSSKEKPDFQRHVVPLLGRLGCNGRACHGSFQGRGGFRLSLFGYDFTMDHKSLTAKASSEDGLRIDRGSPDDSLILRKPTLRTDHEGGARFEEGSWEERLLARWIETGAPGKAKPSELRSLFVEPAEIVFREPGRHSQLKIIAEWQDGSREDVTCLCRFRSNDESVVLVTQNGALKATGRGDTHVVAFYDNGVVSVPTMIPVSDLTGEQFPKQKETSPIDRLVNDKLRSLGLVPSDVCTDAEFLRRVSIDLTGTLPKPSEVESFLADRTPEKRLRKIDELLKRRTWSAMWANKLCDFTGCNPNQQAELGQDTAAQWYGWIYRRLADGVPYDQIVADIVLARGRSEGDSWDDYVQQTSSYFKDDSATDFSERTTLPHYWTRRSMKEPKDRALAFAHSFLGIRLQCAQCHKHPYAQWTQRDFQQFSSFFENVKFGVRSEDQTAYRNLAKKVGLQVRGNQGSPVRPDVLVHAQEGRVVPWRELYIEKRKGATKLSLLRSGEVNLAPDDDPREPILAWMRDPKNPWFARAFVNRVWASCFHAGIVDPPDDLNPANPPSHPKLLDWLAKEFVEHDYDIRWLHREIARSATYQRSWKPNETNRDDRRNFSRAIPRRIPAEVVYDGLKQATAANDKLDEVRNDLTRRATGHLSMRMAGTYAMHVFGKPERVVNCDCERVNSPTLLQSIFLQNDPLTQMRVDESGWIAEIAGAEKSAIAKGGSASDLNPADLVRSVWLRTVNRPPTETEIKRAMAHLESTKTVAEGITDLTWALINSKEFILNH